MKTKLLLFTLLLFVLSCGEEGSELPSPCTISTPELNFKYEPGKITVSWDDLGNYNYNLNYFVANRPNEFYGTDQVLQTDTFAIISSLLHPGNTYLAQIEVSEGDSPIALNRCNGSIESVQFIVPCSSYSGFYVQNITTTSATVSWNAVGEPIANLFTVNVRKKGTTNVTVNGTDQESIQLTALQPSTDYQVQLASICTDGQVYTSDWKDFKTL
jgi:hypothetical protein